MTGFLAVFLGGGVGATLRHALTLILPSPWSTWVVNILGSALLAALIVKAEGLSPELRLLLGTGLMGGFTTYSTFNADTLRLVEGDQLGMAALNVAGTLVLCLIAGLAGGWLARSIG